MLCEKHKATGMYRQITQITFSKVTPICEVGFVWIRGGLNLLGPTICPTSCGTGLSMHAFGTDYCNTDMDMGSFFITQLNP